MSKELIKALEWAEKGSREMDFRIWLAAERDETVCPTVPAAFRCDLSDEFTLYDDQMNSLGWIGFHMVPRYSVSLEAAIALSGRVMTGWYVGVQPWFHSDPDRVMSRAYLVRPDWSKWNPVDDEWVEARYGTSAPSPALAVCIAILKAQGAQQ